MNLSSAVFLLALCLGGGSDDLKPLQGKWKVVAVFEDGQSLPQKDIAAHFFVDGTVTIDGPVISFLALGSFEPRKIAYSVDAKAEPKAIDLVGVSKIGSKGIYLASGDSLMICLADPKAKTRPSDFGAGKGSGRALLVLKRAAANEPAATPANSIKPAAVPVPRTADDMRKSLIGTWGHQTDEAVRYYTLNADGSFAAVIEWKKGLKRLFKEEVRSSGTWKLEGSVIIATVTSSTDANLRNQVFSWRINDLGTNNLIAVDGQGRLRHEWRVR